MNKDPNTNAKFVISIDTEFAWGSFFDEAILLRRMNSFKKTRKTIDAILHLFEKYNISATWAIVGHLMLKECTETEGVKYPDIIRPEYDWYNKDWFHYVPCKNKEENSVWFAPDVIERIKNCSVNQDIGMHSFSHIVFGDEGTSRECAESDLRKCIQVANDNNITPVSFVYPRNYEGHKELLMKYGFKIYRSIGYDKYWKIKNIKIKRLLLIFDKVLALKPTTSKLKVDETGILKLRGDLCYFRYKGWRNLFMKNSAVIKAKKGIDLAIKNGEIFHFWFHPFELAANPEKSIDDLEKILKYADSFIKKGKLTCITMRQLAENFK